jgi:hypothetical protein
LIIATFVASFTTRHENIGVHSLSPGSALWEMTGLVGKGGEQNAPLRRAVIGGLIFAAIATLIFVPVIFSTMSGKWQPEAAEAGGELSATYIRPSRMRVNIVVKHVLREPTLKKEPGVFGARHPGEKSGNAGDEAAGALTLALPVDWLLLKSTCGRK